MSGGANPAFVASPSSPAVSTKGFNPGDVIERVVSAWLADIGIELKPRASRSLAQALEPSLVTEEDVLRVIDACGGTYNPATPDWNAGHNAALDDAEREMKRLFARAKGAAQ